MLVPSLMPPVPSWKFIKHLLLECFTEPARLHAQFHPQRGAGVGDHKVSSLLLPDGN